MLYRILQLVQKGNDRRYIQRLSVEQRIYSEGEKFRDVFALLVYQGLKFLTASTNVPNNFSLFETLNEIRKLTVVTKDFTE